MGGIDRRDGNSDSAELLNGEEGNDPLDAVGDVDDNPIAFLDTEIVQSGGETVDIIHQAAIGVTFSQINDGDLIWISVADPFKPGEIIFPFALLTFSL
jgi:hypothetical protein